MATHCEDGKSQAHSPYMTKGPSLYSQYVHDAENLARSYVMAGLLIGIMLCCLTKWPTLLILISTYGLVIFVYVIHFLIVRRKIPDDRDHAYGGNLFGDLVRLLRISPLPVAATVLWVLVFKFMMTYAPIQLSINHGLRFTNPPLSMPLGFVLAILSIPAIGGAITMAISIPVYVVMLIKRIANRSHV